MQTKDFTSCRGWKYLKMLGIDMLRPRKERTGDLTSWDPRGQPTVRLRGTISPVESLEPTHTCDVIRKRVLPVATHQKTGTQTEGPMECSLVEVRYR